MTDNEKKELNDIHKKWKDQHEVSDLIEKYDIKHPIYLILESDEREPKGSVSAPPSCTKLQRNLRKMNKADKLRYLEVMEDIIHKYNSIKMTPLPSKTDYGERLIRFKREHGRRPYKDEKDQLLKEAENAYELYTDEYKKLRSKVLELNEKLQDKAIFEGNDDVELWDQLDKKDQKRISRAISGMETDGRTKYGIAEYRYYLTIHLLSPDKRTRDEKKKEAAEYLTGDAKDRMLNANDPAMKRWEDWLR